VKADDVAPAHEVVELDCLDAHGRQAPGVEPWGCGDHLEAEGSRATRDFGGHSTEPDEPERAAAKPVDVGIVELLPTPVQLPAQGELADPACGREKEQESVIGDFVNAIIGHVGDADAPLSRGRNIDDVEAGAASDQEAHRRQPLDDLAIERADTDEEDVGVARSFSQRTIIETGRKHVDQDSGPSQSLDTRHDQIPGVGCNDSQGPSSQDCWIVRQYGQRHPRVNQWATCWYLVIMSDNPALDVTPSEMPRQPRATLERVTTTEALVRALTRQILDGAISGGDHLREVDLADEMGVSRQSLRTALIELVHMGLLRREAHRGVWVPRLTRGDIEDLYDIRTVIESAAIRRLTKHPERWYEVEDAIDALARLDSAAGWGAIVEADFAVHRALVATARSPRLSHAHEMLCAETRLSLVRAQHFWTAEYLAAEHRDLFQVIASGDEDAADQRLHEHLRIGLDQILADLSAS